MLCKDNLHNITNSIILFVNLIWLCYTIFKYHLEEISMNSMESNAVCTNCGAPLVPEQLFCMQCGTPVNRGEVNNTSNNEANNYEANSNYQGQEYHAMNDTYQNWGQSTTNDTYSNMEQSTMEYTYQNQDANAMGYTYQSQDPYTMNYSYQNQEQNGMNPPYQQVVNQPKPPLSPEQKKKRNIIIAAASVGTILVVSLAIFLSVYFSYTRLDCKSMYIVKYEGVNGKGSIDLSVDMSSKEYEKVGDSLSKLYLIYGISFEADKVEELSNGDKINVKVDYNEELFKENKIKLKNTEFTLTVEGLVEATAIDLFEGLEITYTGFEGYATPVFDLSGCDSFVQSYVEFSTKEDASHLKEGDEITVVAKVDESDLIANGYKTDVTVKNYKVSGLQKISDYDVFQDVALKFEGASPLLSVDLDLSNVNSDISPYVRFSLDKETNLKNGDVITITASIDKEDLLEMGYDIKETEKQVTVEGEEEYMITMKKEDAATPDAAILSYLDREFSLHGEGYIFDQSLETIFGEGFTYKDGTREIVKRYFLYNQEKNPVNCYMTIVKYTVTVVNQANEETSKEFYVMTNASNLIMSEGTLNYIEPLEYLIDESQAYFEQSVTLLEYEVTNVEPVE